MFRVAVQTWLREVSGTPIPYRYEFGLLSERPGIWIRRSGGKPFQTELATIYQAHPNSDGQLVDAPWTLANRQGLMGLLPPGTRP